jgi:hypothetical protein
MLGRRTNAPEARRPSHPVRALHAAFPFSLFHIYNEPLLQQILVLEKKKQVSIMQKRLAT